VLAARHATALGLVLARAGRYAEALDQQARAVELLRIEHGDATAPVGVQLHRVAELEFELGRLDDAEASARRSAEIIVRTHGGDHPRVALPLTVLAQIACAQGAWERCIERAERAAARRVRAAGQVEGALLPIMLTHGRGLVGAGRIEDAETTLRAATQLARETYGDNSAWSGRADAELAAALPPGEEARMLADRSIAVLERTLGDAHPDTLAAKKRLARVVVSPTERVLP
jgi:tetratricopeptide (TPR) repeat protein